MQLQKANEHIELLSKLAEANKTSPPAVPEEKKGAVTINNNYNSSVIAVINKESNTDIPKVQDKSDINIFVGDSPKKPEANLAESSFTEIVTQSNKLSALTSGLPEPDNKERIMDRLLQSVNMVKEVLQSNLKLREQVQELTQRVDLQNAELFHLQCENEEQKDKIQILAGMNNGKEIQIQPELGKDDISLEEDTKKQAKMDVAEEIWQLKKDKSMLEQRIHYLEIENINMHTNTSHEKPTNLPGTDDFEPVRSVLNGAEIRPLAPIRRNAGSTQMRKFRKQIRGKSELQVPPRTSYAKLRNAAATNKISSK